MLDLQKEEKRLARHESTLLYVENVAARVRKATRKQAPRRMLVSALDALDMSVDSDREATLLLAARAYCRLALESAGLL